MIEDYCGINTPLNAANLLLAHYSNDKTSKDKKVRAIEHLELFKGHFAELPADTRKALVKLKEKLVERSKPGKNTKKILNILESLPFFIPRAIPKMPVQEQLPHLQDHIENAEEDFATFGEALAAFCVGADSLTDPVVLIKGEEADPINDQLLKFRKEQTKYFLDILTLLINDYLIGDTGDDHDDILKQSIATTLQPILVEIVKSYCFPDPSSTDPKGKIFIGVVLQQLDLFISHISSGFDTARLNMQRATMNLPELATRDSLKLKEMMVGYLQEILIKVIKIENPILTIIPYILANKLSKLLFRITEPQVVHSVIKKLLSENLQTLDATPPVELFDASDSDFSKTVGIKLFELAKKLIQFGNPTGGTRLILSQMQSSLSGKTETIGENVQKALSRLAQSSSRLQLFYILSLIFWKQEEKQWIPHLIKCFDAVSHDCDSSEIALLLNNKLSSILGINVDENASYFAKGTSALMRWEGSLPQFAQHLSETIANLLLDQTVVLYGVVYILEGINEQLNTGVNK